MFFGENPVTVQEAAETLYRALHTKKRGPHAEEPGTEYVCLREDIPEALRSRLRDIAFRAHGDMMPDDWRYDLIRRVSEALMDADDAEEIDLDSLIDVYTSERTAWLASRNDRKFYCDEARQEGLLEPDSDMDQILGVGQYMELREVHGLLLEALGEWADAAEDTDEEEN